MIVDKLNTILNSYPTDSTKYTISHFIKNHILEIPTMSINTIALNCNTSKGQISKYVHSLGYETLADFKADCKEYIDGMKRTKKDSYLVTKNHLKQLNQFTQDKIDTFNYALANLNEKQLNLFINDFIQCDRVYIYARGHARSLCNYIQNELSTHYKEAIICDIDFTSDYHFTPNDLLLIISIDGNTFNFNQRVIRRIQQKEVKTWLISCNDQITTFTNKLYIPSNHDEYNDYLIRHILDFILKY